MKGILSGKRGMAPVALVIVIAAALLAVLFLTGTLVAARNIDRNVENVITPTFSETPGNVGAEAKFIREAKKTVRISGDIDEAAKPLTGHADRTLGAARSIDRTAKQILNKAGPINRTVREINGTVLQIGATVDSIFGNVGEIGGLVQSINRTARGIGTSVGSISRSASEINASARDIRSDARTILSETGTIEGRVVSGVEGGGVRRVNAQALDILNTARPIAGDLNTVLGLVGTNISGQTILAHANSIDCSRILQLGGPTQACER